MLHVNENGAVYCEYCEMWLNGPTQWEDHKIGKKHKKHVRQRGPPPRCWNSYAGDEDNRKDSPRDDPLPKKKLLTSAAAAAAAAAGMSLSTR